MYLYMKYLIFTPTVVSPLYKEYRAILECNECSVFIIL